MTHTQVIIYTWLAVLAGLAWTVFWAWVWYMAFRVLRWTYLEKRHAWRTVDEPAWQPPAVTTTWR